MTPRRTQAERTAATRAALIRAARALFAQHGFTGTATADIVQRAGVTRGALYHHFDGKADLFASVYRDVEQDLVETIVDAAETAGEDPLARLRAGADTFLDACLAPEVHRITLLDAPAVLGWEEWKRLDAEYGLGVVKAALAHAMEAGMIADQPLGALAHVVLGALTEGALYVARADDPARTREEVGRTVHRLIDGLATTSGG